jgi:hypothetical protein
MPRVAVLSFVAWLAMTGSHAGEVVAPPASRPDSGSDRVVRRALVPSPERAVGEVRLVQRGEAAVVQTLLRSKVLKRVVAEIAAKEERNWPPDRPGHEDMRRYVEALDAAQRDLWSRVPKGRGTPEPQHLLIEFIADRTSAFVVLAEYEATGDGDALQVTARRSLGELALSREYVTRNMVLILEDAFRIPAAEAAALPPLAAVLGTPGPQ